MAFPGNFHRIIGLLRALRREVEDSPLSDEFKGVVCRAADRYIYRIHKEERRMIGKHQMLLPFEGEDALLLM